MRIGLAFLKYLTKQDLYPKLGRKHHIMTIQVWILMQRAEVILSSKLLVSDFSNSSVHKTWVDFRWQNPASWRCDFKHMVIWKKFFQCFNSWSFNNYYLLHDQLIQIRSQEIWLVQSRSVNPHTAREIPYSPRKFNTSTGCPAPMFAESVYRVNMTNKLKQCGSRKALQRDYWV